ncbi:gag-pol polyprotein [Tanacetum coccineum]
MSTQQDIYVAGSKNHPPMLNKDNYVPWSYRLLRYAKSKPNRKLIYNSIMHGSYVRRIIPEPGDPDREVPVAETFHEQTDEELTEKKKSGNGNGNGNNRNQIRCYNYRGMGHLARNCTVRPKRRDAASLQTQLLNAQKEEAGIQLQAEEFDLMTAARDLDKIEEVNANCIWMANLQQALTSSTQTNKAPVYDLNGSAKTSNPCQNIVDESLAKHKALEHEIERLLRAVINQDIMSIMQSNSVVNVCGCHKDFYMKFYNSLGSVPNRCSVV